MISPVGIWKIAQEILHRVPHFFLQTPSDYLLTKFLCVDSLPYKQLFAYPKLSFPLVEASQKAAHEFQIMSLIIWWNLRGVYYPAGNVPSALLH